MKTIKSISLIALVLALFSCKRNMDELLSPQQQMMTQGNQYGINAHGYCNPDTEEPVIMMCGGRTVNLCNENYQNIGTVTIESGSDMNIYITYKTTGNWYLKECMLYAGDAAMIPATGLGTPVPDLFPYIKTYSYNNLTKEYTFVCENLTSTFEVLAMAKVVRVVGGQVQEEVELWADGCGGNTRINMNQ